jgi:very-short-patch-repair endonuclease
MTYVCDYYLEEQNLIIEAMGSVHYTFYHF